MAALLNTFLLTTLLLIGAFAGAEGATESAKKVPVALHYEALCGACGDFMVNDLPKVFKDGLIDVIDLTLVPYGNAHVSKNGTISCQHGADECLLNTVEACAIDTWPDLVLHTSSKRALLEAFYGTHQLI